MGTMVLLTMWWLIINSQTTSKFGTLEKHWKFRTPITRAELKRTFVRGLTYQARS